MSRSAHVLVAVAAGILAALALHLPVTAQEGAPPQAGRYRISTIPGAVYLVDTATGDVFVREYQTKRWKKAGNGPADAE